MKPKSWPLHVWISLFLGLLTTVLAAAAISPEKASYNLRDWRSVVGNTALYYLTSPEAVAIYYLVGGAIVASVSWLLIGRASLWLLEALRQDLFQSLPLDEISLRLHEAEAKIHSLNGDVQNVALQAKEGYSDTDNRITALRASLTLLEWRQVLQRLVDDGKALLTRFDHPDVPVPFVAWMADYARWREHIDGTFMRFPDGDVLKLLVDKAQANAPRPAGHPALEGHDGTRFRLAQIAVRKFEAGVNNYLETMERQADRTENQPQGVSGE